jgi:H+/Cl- antiporter ClcA
MQSTRYVAGAIGFLLVWVVIAGVVKFLVIHFISPGHGAFFTPGNDWTWRDIPGTLLGLVAGIQSFRASIREPQEGSNKLMRGFTWILGITALVLTVFVGIYLCQNL